MAEYINKEELIKACNYTVCYEDDDDEETFGISEAMIDLMPTIDIVRCKDCKYYDKSIRLCDIGHSACDPDWFCADMRRRD